MRVLFPSIFCFLQPCWQPHRFPNQLRGLKTPHVGPRTGVAYLSFKLLTPQKGISKPV